ncbi:MAG: PH domain-containing protein [Micropepsaceae bacterium]
MASHVDKALVEGEVVIARAHYHWLNWVLPCLALILPVVIQLLSWIYVGADTRAWLNYITVGLIIAGGIYFLWQVIRIRSTEIAVTDRRFIRKTGWIGRDTAEIELRSIEEVKLKMTVTGRIFGYGTLIIRGTGAGVVESPGLDDPKIFQKAIQTAQERLRVRLGIPAAQPPTG